MMRVEELSIGNWVLDGEKSIPMYVTSIHRDGTVYLDFPGNNALDWETDVKDLVPIEVTEEMLLEWGFKNSLEEKGIFNVTLLQGRVANNHVEVRKMANKRGADWSVHIDNEDFCSIGCFDFQYVHEFQNYISILTGQSIRIEEITLKK